MSKEPGGRIRAAMRKTAMKTSKVLAVATILAGIWLMLQGPARVLAQDAPPPDQSQTDMSAQQPPSPGQPDDQSQAPAQDPPARVARLSYSVGSVSFQPGGEGDWVTAVNNRPLTTGDNLWADKDSRAEFQVGSTSVRMDSETSVTILQLDDRTTQLRLSQGSILFRVRHLDDDDHFEIDTPNSAFVVQRTGEYRVDVNADGSETDTTVWRGRGEVTGGGASYDVIAGQRARFTGTQELDHEIDQLPARDDFDSFAFDRDDHEDRAESANYISPETTGYEDLDEYGQWHYAADYGPVWTPVGVPVGWAPYRFGHWVWVSPWGWTWVESEPWGFAPFHYGRWAFVGGGWCWAPGPVAVRPVFAPALVAFVGGGGFAVGVGVGPAVAWFPLAPREVFVPWYRTSRVYVTNVNITNTRVNVTQVTNVYNTTIINNRTVNNVTYANQHVSNAVTAVSHDTFVNARAVGTNLVKVDERQIASAPVMHSIPVQPVRQSVVGAGRPAMARPPAAVVNRPVVATRMPTPPRPSFEQRQAAMNVHTVTPGTPQPAVRPQPEPRPMANNRLEEQGTAPPERTAAAPVQRPATTIPRPPAPSNYASPHPLVKAAPPVQEQPERQQNEEQKFNKWQQQRPAPAPAAASHPAAHNSAPPAHEPKPHK
jgi:FecR protein